MDIFLSFLGLIVLAFVAFAIARFVLRLTGLIVGCVVTAIIGLGILIILIVFVF